MTQPRGNFVWHELLTPNKESASAFYPRVVGWKTQAWDKAPGYTLWTGPRGPLGGLGTLSPGGPEPSPDAPMGWLPFIGVPDAHRTVEQARSLGARILTDVTRTPAGGEWAVLADPQGAVFAVYASSGGEEGAGSEESPSGEFSWHELGTSDYQAALEFYAALFGWSLDRVHDMGDMGDYALFSAGGRQVGGMYNNLPHDGHTPPPGWLCYVRVDELESAIDKATGAGGTVLLGPMDVPGGSRIAMLLDPDGMRFALHQPPRAPARAAAQAKKARPSTGKALPAKSQATADKKPAAKKTAARKGSAQKQAAPKTAAKKSPARKSGAKKSSAKKSAMKKSAARRPAAKKAATQKSGARRGASKTARKSSRSTARRSAAVRRGTVPRAGKGGGPARGPARKSTGRGRRGRR